MNTANLHDNKNISEFINKINTLKNDMTEVYARKGIPFPEYIGNVFNSLSNHVSMSGKNIGDMVRVDWKSLYESLASLQTVLSNDSNIIENLNVQIQDLTAKLNKMEANLIKINEKLNRLNFEIVYAEYVRRWKNSVINVKFDANVRIVIFKGLRTEVEESEFYNNPDDRIIYLKSQPNHTKFIVAAQNMHNTLTVDNIMQLLLFAEARNSSCHRTLTEENIKEDYKELQTCKTGSDYSSHVGILSIVMKAVGEENNIKLVDIPNVADENEFPSLSRK